MGDTWRYDTERADFQFRLNFGDATADWSGDQDLALYVEAAPVPRWAIWRNPGAGAGKRGRVWVGDTPPHAGHLRVLASRDSMGRAKFDIAQHVLNNENAMYAEQERRLAEANASLAEYAEFMRRKL